MNNQQLLMLIAALISGVFVVLLVLAFCLWKPRPTTTTLSAARPDAPTTVLRVDSEITTALLPTVSKEAGELSSRMGQSQTPAPAPAEPSIPIALLHAAEERIRMMQGRRRIAALLMRTGTFSIGKLAETLAWSYEDASQTLSSMKHDKFAAIDRFRNYYLTGKGIALATWWSNNPKAVRYGPKAKREQEAKSNEV